MHKLILIALIVLPHSLLAQRVEVEQYTKKLAEIVSLFESNIMNAKVRAISSLQIVNITCQEF
ncbi:MAG: hypothetical protein NW218_02205 [Saprospiraceae bacterium]|nr:hypothetical protein [Saprospiraceae bacterium]